MHYAVITVNFSKVITYQQTLHLGRELNGAEMQNLTGLDNDVFSASEICSPTYTCHSVLFVLLISQVYAFHNDSQNI